MTSEDSIEPTASTVQRGVASAGSRRSGSAERSEAGSQADAPSGRDAAFTDEPPVSDEAQTVIRGSSAAHRSLDDPFPSPATPAADRTPAAVAKVLSGRRLNHFQLEELIGGGGMGAVFRAHDEHLDRIVAIKVIPFVGEDFDLGRRFRNEAQSAAKLDHPNIARVFDVGQQENWHYIVFEYVEGTNIRDRVLRDGAFTIDDAVFATCQLAGAIGHAAERGIVHRDIKPSNVVINLQEQIKLVDMGLARSENVELSEDMTASGVTLGTFDYISPEQALDPRDADVRSDIYSLGCTMYFMLTSRPPYPGGTMLQKLLSHGNAPPPDPRVLRSDISDDLAMVLEKMLAKSPADRYQTVHDLIADLQEVAVREGLTRSLSIGAPSLATPPAWGQAVHQAMPWLAAAAVLLIGAGWLQIHSMMSEDAVRVALPAGDEVVLIPEPADSNASTRPGESPESEPPSLDAPETARSALADASEPPLVPGDPATSAARNDAGMPLGDATVVSPGQAGGDGAGDAVGAGLLGGDREGLGLFDSADPSITASPSDPPQAVPDVADAGDPAGLRLPDGRLALPFSSSPPTIARVVDSSELNAFETDLKERSVEGVAYVTTLEKALELAQTYRFERVELAAPLIRSGPIRIRPDQLEIVSVANRTMLLIQSPDSLAIRRPQMIDVQSSRIEWKNIDIVWEVPESETDGGSLFTMTENRMFRMEDCTVTIRNVARRDQVYAFEVFTDPQRRRQDAVVEEMPRETSLGEGSAGDGSAAAFASTGEVIELPLVAIELTDVVVRGEITMLHLDHAAGLQLVWNNGFLAVSQRMIDTAGALLPTGKTTPAMQVELNRVTASIPEGLYRMRLGGVGDYPVALKREAQRCVFLVRPGVPHFEIVGIDEDTPIKSLVRVLGEANAYAYPQGTDLQDPFVAVGEIMDQPRAVMLVALISDSLDWSSELDPFWSVRWSESSRPTRPPSEWSPADFRQDGSILSGFDEQSLPSVPMIDWN